MYVLYMHTGSGDVMKGACLFSTMTSLSAVSVVNLILIIFCSVFGVSGHKWKFSGIPTSHVAIPN